MNERTGQKSRRVHSDSSLLPKYSSMKTLDLQSIREPSITSRTRQEEHRRIVTNLTRQVRKKSSAVKNKKKRSVEGLQKLLSPKCDKIHLVKDCYITSAKYKTYFLKERYHEKNKSKSAKKVTKAAVAKSLPDENEGRYRICFEDQVAATALKNYGYDVSALSAEAFEKVVNVVQDLTVNTFDNAMELKSTFDASK